MPRLRQRVLAERRRDVGALDLLERHRQRTGLEDEREVLRLADRAALAEVDLGVRAGDAVRVALEVDVRRRLELPVEHDREVLGVVEVVALLPGEIELRLAALRLVARDLLELVGAVVRELQRHDRAAALAEVGARAGEHEVAAGHLRNRVARAVREELHQVVVGPARRDHARAEAAAGLQAADHDRVRRHVQHLGLRRHLAAERLEQLVKRVLRATDQGVLDDGLRGGLEHRLALLALDRHLLRRLHLHALRTEEVVRLRRALRGLLLHLRQQLVERRRRDRIPVQVERRAGQVVLEVEQHQLRGLADQLRGRRRVVHAGELDDDLILALLADLRLGHAELVDPVLHDRRSSDSCRRASACGPSAAPP